MRKSILAAALVAFSSSAYADAINNLDFGILPNPVPQSASAPCVICATTQAHNPIGFGYNNFNSQGNDSTFNLFSSNLTGAFGDGVQGTAYTAGQLVNFLQALPLPDLGLTFGIAIDINTAQNNEHLDFFQLINLSAPAGQRIIFDIRDVDMPVVDNGNGKADYLLTGFDLSGINPGDNLIFRAQWSGASDGGESFYIVALPQAVPGPLAGAGAPGLIIATLGLIGLARRRRRTA